MIYKNSMKLLTSNFSLVWKQLAYTIVRLAIIIGLTWLVSYPIIELLAENNYIQTIKNIGDSLYTNTTSIFVDIKFAIEQFFGIIGTNMSKVWGSVLGFFFIVIIVNSYLKSVGKFVLTSVAHNNYTSLNNSGYMHTMLTNIKNISKYAAAMIVQGLPFTLLKIAYVVLYCHILDNWIVAIVGITILIILYTFTYSIQLSIYAGIVPELITKNINPFKSTFSIYKTSKDFAKVFSNALVIVLTVIFTNILVGVFTIGAGLLITVPASMVLVNTFQLVGYYSTTKQRYYLSPTIIVDTTIGKKEEIK